jgi:thiol:disulfide interchange protein DsbA
MHRSPLVGLLLSGIATFSFAAPQPAKAPKSSADWRAGYEYSVLIPSEAPEDVPAGQIEVRELFLYTSGWSKGVQPNLQTWLDAKGSAVKYVREPAIAFPHAKEQARLYYTLKALGREDLHAKFWDFVRDPERYPVYHTIRRPAVEAIEDMNIKFGKDNGVDPKAFIAAYESRDVDNQVIAASIDATSYHLNGTSTFVVNGKYSTSLQRFLGADPACADRGPQPGDYDRFFRLLDQLLDVSKKENASGTAHPTSAAPQPPPAN